MWEFIIYILLTVVIPVLINQAGPPKIGWIQKYVRPIWTSIFAIFTLYLIQKPWVVGVIMECQKKTASNPLVGYMIWGLIGIIVFCGYWWFAGKMFIETSPSKSESSIQAIPEIVHNKTTKLPPTTAELEALLREQLQFLQRSSEYFDRSMVNEAKRIASSLYILLIGSADAPSLLEQLRLRDNFQLPDTSHKDIKGNLAGC